MNSSGIYPRGDRILIKPEEIEKVTSGGIIIPDTEAEKYANAQTFGELVDVGPDAWSDYTEPFAYVGERIMFAKYGGLKVTGKDGVEYRLSNDTDVTATVDKEVQFTELKGRERFGRTE